VTQAVFGRHDQRLDRLASNESQIARAD
jgi:hypothetical protein